MIKFIEVKTKPTWMVLMRHLSMEGGVMTYGVGEILEFFESFKAANKYAKSVVIKMESKPMLRVWVLKCERTYHNDGNVAK